MSPSIWIGIDTGGTFSDVVLIDVASGAQHALKAPTTPDDPARGILQGVTRALARAGATPDDVAIVLHGTTLATNAVLEGKWARTGLIATRGFRDVLALGRQRRPSFFNLDIEKPRPPAEADACQEADERLAADGAVVHALDEDSVRRAAPGAERHGVCGRRHLLPACLRQSGP